MALPYFRGPSLISDDVQLKRKSLHLFFWRWWLRRRAEIRFAVAVMTFVVPGTMAGAQEMVSGTGGPTQTSPQLD